MSDAAVPVSRPRGAGRGGAVALRIGWRNLGRNPRRTWLVAGGIAFAVFLVTFSMCLQHGTYASQIDLATSLLTGHIEVASEAFVEDARLEATLEEGARLRQQIADTAGVAAVAPRVEVFMLASAGERSFGAQVLGVEADAEAQVVTLAERIVAGRNLSQSGEGVVGERLARNLGLALGDEVVLLGAAREGGVAAFAVNVVGLLRTDVAEIDRSLLLAPIGDVQDAVGFGDEVHTIALRAASLDDVDAVVTRLTQGLPERWPPDHEGAERLRVRGWGELLPEIRQAIELDRVSGVILYWVLMILVSFSVVNGFIMTVFERTREFGLLLAIGMHPLRIVGMLQWEAALLWLIGAGIGALLAVVVVAWLARTGIHLGGNLQDITAGLYVPDRIYPGFSRDALVTAPLVMLLGTQLGALLPALRIHRLRPVAALRAAA